MLLTCENRQTCHSLRNIQNRKRALDNRHTDTGHMRTDTDRIVDKAKAAGLAWPCADGPERNANRNRTASRVETQIDFSLSRSSRAPASGRKELFPEAITVGLPGVDITPIIPAVAPTPAPIAAPVPPPAMAPITAPTASCRTNGRHVPVL